MATMNVSLPDTLKAFVDAQVADHGFSTSSEYIRALIRHDQDRERLRMLMLEGGASPMLPAADAGFFAGLRARATDTAQR